MCIVLAVNIETHDRERSEKEKDLDGQTLGKNEKELLVIDNLSYQGHNIVVNCDKIQFINKLVINFKYLQIPKNPNIVEIPKIPENSKMKSNGTEILKSLGVPPEGILFPKIPGKCCSILSLRTVSRNSNHNSWFVERKASMLFRLLAKYFSIAS